MAQSSIREPSGSLATGFAMRTYPLREWALTKEQRDRLTPDDVIKQMKLGNERFRMGKPSPHDYVSQKRSSFGGTVPIGRDTRLH